MRNIKRFGVSVENELLKKFDEIIEKKGYNSRSEAIRDLIRGFIIKEKWERKSEKIAGTINIIYDHEVHGLVDKLIDIQHNYQDIIISTLHVHFDIKNCLEVIVVKGRVERIKKFYDDISSIKWVKHTNVSITDIL